jgi:hypothetical protein
MWPQLENAAAVMVESATTEQRPESCDGDGGLEEEEFEFFSMSSSSAMAASEDQRIVCPSVVMSSADELFFKGQLLPLHVTPRLRMVQNLASYQKQQQHPKSEKTSQIAPPPPPPPPASVLQTLPCPSFHHPKYSRFWMHSNAELLSSSSSDASTTSAAPDYCGIGSRFRGQWSDLPRERDSCSSTDSCSRDSTSARDSSSSRDSNGSSQDANFSDSSTSKDHFPISSSFLQQQHNREVFRTHVFRSPTEEGSSSSSVVVSSSSTFKLPSFKWKKVLFRAKKVAAVAKSSNASSSLLDPKAGQQRTLHHRLADVSEEESGASASVDTSDAICVGDDDALVCDKHFSDYSGELSSLQSGGGHTESQQAAIVVAADGERDQGGMTKAREYLQKYMRILKPLHHVKKNDELLNCDHLDEQSCRGVNNFMSLPASSSSLLHESGRQSRNVPGNRSFSSFSQTARLASIDFNPRSHSSLGTAAARRGSGRPAVRSSTSTSSGFTSELHSAIQCAIAHCKESQSSAKHQHASSSVALS